MANRHRQDWTPDEDLLLRLMLEMKYPMEEMTDALGRSEGSIRFRQYKLGYDYKGHRK